MNMKWVLASVGVLIALAIGSTADAATSGPTITGGNAVTSNDQYYYGKTEPYASVSYNALDANGKRMVIGATKADKSGNFRVKLNHHLRTGLYTWVYVTDNTGSNKGDYSVYDRVIDGVKYFDPSDPANKQAAAKQTSKEFQGKRRNTTSVTSSQLPAAVSAPTANSVVTTQLKARSQETYPFGNLFTFKPTSSIVQATLKGQTQTTSWLWNVVSSNGVTNRRSNVGFASKFRMPQAGISLTWQGQTYNLDSQQGMQLANDGTVYVEFDNDSNTSNGGAFVLRISAAYAKYLSEKSGNTKVDGKITPIWLDKSAVATALDSGNMALSKLIPAQHGSTFAVWGNTPYILSGTSSAQTMFKLQFKYATAKTTSSPYQATTSAWDGNPRVVLTASSLGTGQFFKNDGRTVASGITTMPKNFTLVSANTGYFVIPYSQSNGNQKAWWGYTLYQVKVVSGRLVITQVPLVMQGMLGDAGKGSDPVQSITYNPWDGKLYITSNDAWVSYNLSAYVTAGNNLLGKYNKVAYGDAAGNPITQPANINIQSVKLNSKMETEQLAFFGNTTYILGNTNNQILISK